MIMIKIRMMIFGCLSEEIMIIRVIFAHLSPDSL